MGATCGKGVAPHGPVPILITPPEGRKAGHSLSTSATPSLNTAGRAQLIFKHAGSIREVYDMDSRTIGEGSFGSVSLGTHRATGVVRAIKSVPKGNARIMEALNQEIATMKAMDHPHIIRLFEMFEDRRCIYFAMEHCSGGELFDRIIEAGRFSEGQAAIVMQQILHAVFYMHDSGVVHRDLKPENFLFQSKDPIETNTLKLIDFGLARSFERGRFLKTKAGTALYMAPQVLMGRYDQQCDLWSVGAIMYVLLSGRPPFPGRSDEEILAKVRQGQWKFEGSSWQRISDDAKDLVSGLLKLNPRLRCTAGQALGHRWIQHRAPNAADVELQGEVLERLRGFKAQNRLHKAALGIVASQLNEGRIKELRATFEALDCNRDGKVTVAELAEGMQKAGLDLTGIDAAGLVEGADGNNSGAIDYTEFLAATLDRRSLLTEDVLWTAFNVFDENGDGRISERELRRVLSSQQVERVLCRETIARILAEVDTDGDGSIDFKEFAAMMQTSGAASGAPAQKRALGAAGLGGA